VNARPFRLLTATALRDIQKRCDQALVDWAQAWRPAQAGKASEAVQASARAAPQQPHAANDPCAGEQPGLALVEADRCNVWMPMDARDAVAAWLFPGWHPLSVTRGQDDLVAQVAQAALTALMNALMRAFMPQPAKTVSPLHDLPRPLAQAGAPVVELSILLGQHRITASIRDLAWVAARPSAPSTSCEPLLKALDEQTVLIRAELGDIDMDIQALYGLMPGDVIRLRAPLDMPIGLRLQGCTQAPSIRGYLGALDQHRAIEIVALATPT
jgi:flagellar motor switch/type III secretory pathway protein FliN